MSTLLDQQSTGNRINRPSDDPVGTTRVLKYKSDIRVLEQYKKNIKDSQGAIDMTETSLNSIKELLQRLRNLAVAGANQSNSEEDTKKIQVEVDELIKEVIVTGNATNAGKYLFSGLEIDQKLFNDDGSLNLNITSARQKNKEVLTQEITVGEVMEVGAHPIDVFGLADYTNFFSAFVTEQSGKAVPGSKADLSFDIDTNIAYTGDTLDIVFDGVTYNVDESVLGHTFMNPMSKERLIHAFENANNGSDFLSEKADIFFNANDQLVIRAREAGSGHSVNSAMISGGVSNINTTAGTDISSTILAGSAPITDADVAAATGIHKLVMNIDNKDTVITFDFDTMPPADKTVAGIGAKIQSELDVAFPPAGRIQVGATSGMPLSFEVTQGTFGVDVVVAQHTQMIEDLRAFSTGLETYDYDVINQSIDAIQGHLDQVMTVLGSIGGKTNRLTFLKDRTEDNHLTYTDQLTTIYHVDYSEVIMMSKSLESIYRASLAVGNKAVQPSLMDFLR